MKAKGNLNGSPPVGGGGGTASLRVGTQNKTTDQKRRKEFFKGGPFKMVLFALILTLTLYIRNV